jgi:PPOX class probable F420-dependent enzyme
MTERFADAAVQDYLAAKDVVILATIEADGTPLLTPMWFWHDREALITITPSAFRKARNVTRDPRVTLLAESGTRRDIRRVAITGHADIMADGPERTRVVDQMLAKYHPLIEGMWGGLRALPPDRVVLRIVPRTVRSAGLHPDPPPWRSHDD